MAVIKHIANKNSDYGESERYLIFQHNEYTQKPILDEEGHMILREEYYLDGLNCDPFSFASECQDTEQHHFPDAYCMFSILFAQNVDILRPRVHEIKMVDRKRHERQQHIQQ